MLPRYYLGLLDLEEKRIPRGETSATLPIHPHRDGEQTYEDVQTTDDGKHLQWTLLQPTRDEIIHTEAVQIAQVERRECLWGFVPVAFCDVGVDPGRLLALTRKESASKCLPDVEKGHGKVNETIEEYGASPRSLVL